MKPSPRLQASLPYPNDPIGARKLRHFDPAGSDVEFAVHQSQEIKHEISHDCDAPKTKSYQATQINRECCRAAHVQITSFVIEMPSLLSKRSSAPGKMGSS